MANYGPQQSYLLVGGKNVTGDVFSLEESVETVVEECRPLGATGLWDKSLPIGVARVTLDAPGGLYDDRTFGVLAALQDLAQTRQLVAFGCGGDAIGAEAVMLDGTYAHQWKRAGRKDGLTMGSGVHTVTGSRLDGREVHGVTAETGATGNTQASKITRTGDLYLPSVPIASSDPSTDRLITGGSLYQGVVPHGLSTGDVVLITGHVGSTPAIAGAYVVTVIDSDEFTLGDNAGGTVNITVGGTGGRLQKLALDATVNITSSLATDDRFLTAAVHGLTVGDVVKIAGHTSTPTVAPGVYVVNEVSDTTHFRLADFAGATINITVNGSGGTVAKYADDDACTFDLHVPALTLGGYTSVTVTVQHSSDGLTWADLVAFTAFTVAGFSERKTATNVRQHLAARWAFNGAGSGMSVTPFVAAHRG